MRFIGLVLAAVAAVLALPRPASATILGAIAEHFGYGLTYTHLQMGLSGATLDGVVVTRKGQPLLRAARVHVAYVLRDFLPGGNRKYGISAVELDRPQLTAIRFPDGSYNIPLPGTGGGPSTGPPWNLKLRVSDGSVQLIDRYSSTARERRLAFVGANVDAAIVPNAPSSYDVSLTVVDDRGARSPVVGRGRFAPDRGFADQHWTAARLPIATLVDFALPNHSVVVEAAELHDVDARDYAIVDPSGTWNSSLTVRGALTGGVVRTTALATPIVDVHGPLFAYGDGITTTGMRASIGGVPIVLRGGIVHLAKPQLDLVLTGGGSADALRTLLPRTVAQPVTGPLRFAVRAQGAASQPAVIGAFDSPALHYRGMVFRQASAAFTYVDGQLGVVGLAARYGGLGLLGGGGVTFGKPLQSNFAVVAHGTATGVPYASTILRDPHLDVAVVAHGTGSAFGGSGIVDGSGSDGRLDALVAMAPDGTGTIGPFSLIRRDGASAYGRIAFDRAQNTLTGVVALHDFSLLRPAVPAVVDATLVAAADGGRLSALRGQLKLRSPYGDLNGAAAARDGVAAFAGRVRTDLARLPLPAAAQARGKVDAPLRVLAATDGSAIAVQLPTVRLTGTSLHGIPLREVGATIVKRGKVYELRPLALGIGGGRLVAAGTLGAGNEVLATAGGFDLRSFSHAGLVLDGRRLVALARVRGSIADPRVALAVAIGDARYAGEAIAGELLARYQTGRLDVSEATALAAGGVLRAHGSVSTAGGGPPQLAAQATVNGAQLQTVARVAHLPLYYPDGEIDASVHAQGPLNAPRIGGDVRIPRGWLYGLGFADAHATIAGGPGDVTLRNGGVRVGSTTLAFSGAVGGGSERFALQAPHADLADFNDAFLVPDTFAGRGHLALSAAISPTNVQSSGEVAFAGTRWHRHVLGDVAASWATRGRTIDARANVSGASGTANLSGSVAFPAAAPLRDPLHRTAVDARMQVAGLDLDTWLPAAGFRLPILGTVSGSASVRGTPAAPAFALDAALADGLVGGYPLQTLTLQANGDRSAARITALRLSGPGLNAEASGTAGYAASAPLALTLTATSPDLALLSRSAGKGAPVSGSATTTLRLTGTRNAPNAALALTATNLQHGSFVMPRLALDAAADSRTLTVRNAEADMLRGRLLLAGTVPIAFPPPPGRGMVRDAPFTARLQAEGLDLAQLDPLLPAGSQLAGLLNGTVTAGGTIPAPSFGGGLALTGGSYASSLLRSPLTDLGAQLSFHGTDATLSGLHAAIGGGTIDGSGTAAVGNLRDPLHTSAFDARLTAARAGFSIANLFTGTIDGTFEALEQPAGIPVLVGDLTFSRTRVPLAALLALATTKPGGKPPPPLALDLRVTAGNDVGIASPIANVNATGSLKVLGTLAAPALDGRLIATNGTIDFYRTFTLQHATVAFDPNDGIVPDVNATATTYVSNPSTDIVLNVSGPATHLNLKLASQPSYDQAQILGLLVGAQNIGAVAGVQTQAGGNTGVNPTALAEDFLTSQFTGALLTPLSKGIGEALGLQSVSLGYTLSGGLTTGLRTRLGDRVSVSFNQSFGVDQRQSLALVGRLTRYSNLRLTLFNAGRQVQIFSNPLAPVGQTNLAVESLAPPPGASGYVFTYQRSFR